MPLVVTVVMTKGADCRQKRNDFRDYGKIEP